jgi:hypothetical protein
MSRKRMEENRGQRENPGDDYASFTTSSYEKPDDTF